MKIVNSGTRYEIYSDNLKTYDKLPAGTYVVKFDPLSGFYLEEYPEFEIKEDKIYGVHMSKVLKVLNAFDCFERNLGVILSGDKGIGKSLFAKILAKEAIKKDIPVIVVNDYIKGIAAYIDKIRQEVLVLFDEFDKTFAGKDYGDEAPQTEMLSLFDGVASGKKMYVITCNQIFRLNDYLVNRPGRFHYHFRFDYPNSEEIREYLKDKLNKLFYPEIDKVASFASKVNLNYDCLRAIAFELNSGEKFENAIKDLNIINTNDQSYDVVVYFENNTSVHVKNIRINMFGYDEEYVPLRDKEGEYMGDVWFEPKKCKFDISRGISIVNGEDLKFEKDEDYNGKLYGKISRMELKMKASETLHYVV